MSEPENPATATATVTAATVTEAKPGSPVLVTGAAGFIGRRVVQLLVKAGHTVRRLDLPDALAATPRPAPSAGAPPGAVSGGDFGWDLTKDGFPAALETALQGVRTVVHLAGVLQDGPTGSIEAVNLKGSLQLIVACEKSDVRRFVYLSSAGAETGQSRYLRSCTTVEAALQKQTRMEEMILRCSPVFGVGDHLLTPIIKLFQSKKWAIPCLQNGWQTFNPIFVDDVATIIGKLVGDEKAQPNVWTLGGAQPIALIDLMWLVQDATHRRKMVLHSPPLITPLVLPLANLIWPEARLSNDMASTLGKFTLLVDGEDNETAGLLQSLPTTLESELTRVVEATA